MITIGRTRTSNLLIRSSMCGHPDPFRSVRDLGLVSLGCPRGSGASRGCSSVWLPSVAPKAEPAARLTRCLEGRFAQRVSLPVCR
jgi:hypothetical protein